MAIALRKEKWSVDTSPRAHALAHIPLLDSLRGVACLSVILYHTPYLFPSDYSSTIATWSKLAVWGWSGVDLFFVLSAFLLTRILLLSKGKPNYFSRFYFRRAVRILPLYYVTLGVIYFAFVFNGSERAEQWYPHRFSLWLFFSNVTMAFKGLSPFGTMHLWSLSVEEQFYVFWPAVVAFLSQKNLRRFCVTSIGLVLLLRTVMVMKYGWGNPTTHFLLPTRFDGMALGALLASLSVETNGEEILRRLGAPLCSLGAGFIFVSVIAGGGFTGLESSVQIYGLTGTALLSGGLVAIAFGKHSSGQPLSVFTKTLAWLGKYSYAAYVLHLPWLRAVDPITQRLGVQGGLMDFSKVVIYLSGTLVLSVLSWHLLEKHFLKLKGKMS